MFKGETVLSGAKHPGTKPKVMHSGGGYYVGFINKEDHVPHTRETRYFETKAEAEYWLRCIRQWW